MGGSWISDNCEGVAEGGTDRLDIGCRRRVKDDSSFWPDHGRMELSWSMLGQLLGRERSGVWFWTLS